MSFARPMARYKNLPASKWDEKLKKLSELVQPCTLCPRACRVKRLDNERGNCGAGAFISLVSYGPHHGEEPCLSGTRGSGTLFFGHCNLHCIFCQNADISQDHAYAQRFETTPDVVARVMLDLQARGCHNINWVSPTHYLPMIVTSLKIASDTGLNLPVVYNTHGYDSFLAVQTLDGLIDIYLPDLKYASNRIAEELSGAKDYVENARRVIAEMYRQVGAPVLDENGLMKSGVLVRLLVLPHQLSGTEESLKWLRDAIGPDIGVNIMSQYYPAYRARQYPPLARRVSAEEYRKAVETALHLGFTYVMYDKD